MQPDFTCKPDQESIAVIKKVQQLTAHYWLKTKLSNGLLILAEIVCYVMTVGLFVVAIILTDGKVKIAKQISDRIEIETVIKDKDVNHFFMSLKVAIFLLGLLMIVPAVLFSKMRKKNYVLEEVNTITGEYLKKAG